MRRFAILGDGFNNESTGFATFLTAGQGLELENTDLDVNTFAVALTVCFTATTGTVLQNKTSTDAVINWELKFGKGVLIYADSVGDYSFAFSPTIGVVYKIFLHVIDIKVYLFWSDNLGNSGNEEVIKTDTTAYDSKIIVGTNNSGSRCACYLRDLVFSYGALTFANYEDFLYDRSDTFMLFPLRTDLVDLKEGFTLIPGAFSGCSWGYVGDTDQAKKWL